MKRLLALSLPALLVSLTWLPPAAPAGGERALTLHLRHRVKEAGKDAFTARERQADWDPKETALIVCDMWDDHWCKSASRRVAELARPMNEAVKAVRAKGVFVIHSPSTVAKFYDGTPQRKRPQSAAFSQPPVPLSPADRWGT